MKITIDLDVLLSDMIEIGYNPVKQEEFWSDSILESLESEFDFLTKLADLRDKYRKASKAGFNPLTLIRFNEALEDKS